ncbi:restriction endonuclease subunit S, partial [bacterium]|nr:restriction endonuclease subunit S [bacterium]
IFYSTNLKFYFLCAANAITRYGIGKSAISNVPITFPPLPEQKVIAKFLDQETQKIDLLVGKSEKLIELLKEKRQALISHTVTKGLDPNVKMKDSGVEWLGEIPEHWNTIRLRYLFKIQKRIAGKLGYDVLSITQKGLKIKDIESNAGQLSMDYSKYQIVEINDFAMNHMDLLTGWVDKSTIQGVTSPDYRVFSLKHENSERDFFLRLLQMCYSDKIFFPFGQGSSQFGRWRLPTRKFSDFIFPMPPLNEQRKICLFIDTEFNKIDLLINKSKTVISTLKEKRTSLISAAVTGKIDVRTFIASN